MTKDSQDQAKHHNVRNGNAHHRKQGENYHLDRNDPKGISLSEPRKIAGIATERSVAENDVAETSEQAHSTDGHHDRWQVEPRDQDAVEHAAQQPRDKPRQHDHRRSKARLHHQTHHGRSKRDDRGDR